ncbi:MAG: uroporphyrinogen decarboxylase family protein [Chloroflexota bacterium]
MSTLTPRQRVLTALKREQPDRVPKFADFSAAVYDTFVAKTGVPPPPKSPWSVWIGRPTITFEQEIGLSDPAEYFGYDVRIVEFGETRLAYDFSAYLPRDLPRDRTRVDEWGIAQVTRESGASDFVRPLADAQTVAEIERFPFPDVTAAYRREIARERIRRVQAKGLAAVSWQPFVGGTFFETAWRLRGMDIFLMDMASDSPIAWALLNRITELSIANACFLAECGVDILLTGDDMGMQDRLMLSPAMWRKWIKPRYAELIARVKAINPATLIFYHSDGYVEPLIPELIEIGVDILNPIQPECMDPVKLKRQFGDRLAFWGTLGTQTTFPNATPAELRALVRERIETVGRGGGFLIAPTHKLQADVPWENIVAFFQAVEEYGAY